MLESFGIGLLDERNDKPVADETDISVEAEDWWEVVFVSVMDTAYAAAETMVMLGDGL